MTTSSSLRRGIERTWWGYVNSWDVLDVHSCSGCVREAYVVLFSELCIQGQHLFLGLRHSRSSNIPLERGALMITRRTLEGALKCSLRDFLLLLWRWELIFVIAAVLWTSRVGWVVGIVVVAGSSTQDSRSRL